MMFNIGDLVENMRYIPIPSDLGLSGPNHKVLAMYSPGVVLLSRYVGADEECYVEFTYDNESFTRAWVDSLHLRLRTVNRVPNFHIIDYPDAFINAKKAMLDAMLYGTGHVHVGVDMASGCSHNWSTYVGLERKFEYCTKCDTKRNEKMIFE